MDNNQIKVRVNNGFLVAYEIKDEDGERKGIRIEYVNDEDKGMTPGRPGISLEMDGADKNNELQLRIYDYNSEDPVDDQYFDTNSFRNTMSDAPYETTIDKPETVIYKIIRSDMAAHDTVIKVIHNDRNDAISKLTTYFDSIKNECPISDINNIIQSLSMWALHSNAPNGYYKTVIKFKRDDDVIFNIDVKHPLS